MFYLFILPGECRLSHHETNSGGGGNEADQMRLKTCCSAGCSGVLIGAEETNTSQGAAIDQPTIFFLPHGLTFAFFFFFFAYFCCLAKKKAKNKKQQLPSRKSHSATSPHFSN